MKLTGEEKEQLKKIAKESICSILFGSEKNVFEPSEALKEKSGAFVTLKEKGDLRGCIGYIRGVLPLHETVSEMAVQAAFHDPRFAPLSKEEWEDVDMEISVLTPLKKIADIGEIQVGVHGIYIECGGSAGLLLPQVAVEYEWDRNTFLEHTCYKAGLPKDAWKSKDCNIYIFSAEIF